MYKVTATNLQGDSVRVSLPKPFWGDHNGSPSGPQNSTGVWWIALYFGPKSKRAFLQIYSIWNNGHGSVTGTVFTEIETSTLLWHCERLGIDPPNGIELDVIE